MILILIILSIWIWMFYELWRAPIIKEIGDDGYETIRPVKRISDIFKCKK